MKSVLFKYALPVLLLLAAIQNSAAQAGMSIYTDKLLNGFQDWSWITRNLANTSPVRSGTYSVSATGSAWQALSFYHNDFSVAPYASLTFWAHGGTTGGQQLQVYVTYGPGGTNGTTVSLPSTLSAGTWKQYTLTFSSLGVAGRTDVNRINIQLTSFGSTGTFYVDDLGLIAVPAPALVHVGVNAANAVRTADSRWFGLNTAIWDSSFDTATTSNALKDLGSRVLRFPGGSASDEYHWATGKSLNYTWSWATSWGNFMHVATNNPGMQAFITVNYGTGTSNEAAAWVKSANITNHCGFKYWEIGNECYGSWETDSNSLPHDPYTYAVRSAGYIALMKAADPTIKIGLVAVPGENSYSNNATHFAVNPRTGLTHYGWTPVMLSTLNSLGVTPDFIVHHFYPEYTGTESDPLLLQASGNWAADAADLRQQLTDYLGSSSTNIELLVTENNSNSGQQGKQSTSIVNALYVADSLAQLMKTEFNAFIWWDLRNGRDFSGNFDASLYGWRTYGDLGIMSGGTPTNYPAYYSLKLMQNLVQAGDTVLNATSDYPLLSAYAGLRTNGTLTVLVINKDSTTNLTAQIALSNFTPGTTATVRSYGIAQDEAARTNAPLAAQNVQTNTVSVSGLFTNTFPPYSLTLFTFAPAGSAPIATTLNLASGANPSTYGNTVTLTATVRTNGVAVGNISGQTITFYDGATSLGTGTLNGSGQASYTTSARQLSATSHALTAVYPGNATYSGSTNSPALSQTVNPATLTAGLTGTVSKRYNGTTAATLAAGNYTLSGIVSGDTVTLNNPVSGAYDTRNQGTGKTVTVNGLAISGASATNYTLANTSVAAALGTISQTNITVTAAFNTKTYDGTTSAAATPTITSGSVQTGDSASFTESYSTPTVATGKTLVPAGSVSDGNSGNNYNVTFVNNTTGVITARALTVTASGVNRTYDGTTAAAVTLSDNRVAGDVFTAGYTNATFDTKHVGTGKTVSVSGIYLSGTDATNYTCNPTASATANITALALTVTAVANTKTYDRTTSAAATPTVTAGSVQTGDTADFAETYDTAEVGTGKTLTPSGTVTDGNSGDNYSYTFVAGTNGTINAATVTAGLTGTVSKHYDGTTAAVLTTGHYTLSGVLGGDTVTLNNPAGGTYDTRNAGSGKTVSVTGLAISGPSADNYSLESASIFGAVGAILQTNLTVTAAANTKTYDGTASAAATPTITAGSVQDGDAANFTEAYDTANAGSGKTLTPSGSVDDGNSGDNYSYTFEASTNGIINPATLTYTANPAEMTYGSSVPALSGSVSGFVAGDDLTNATTGTLTFTTTATPSSGVGSYPVNGSGLTAVNGNYDFVQAAGNATALTISALPVNLTGSRVYDGTTTVAADILSVANQVGADDVTVASGSGTVADAAVGAQPIVSFGTLTLGGLSAGNYTLTGASGTVTILSADLVTPVFVGPGISAGSEGWQLSFSAQAGQTYQVLVSGDVALPMSEWTVLTNGTFGEGAVTITDPATNLPLRFYRIVSP